MTRLPISEYRIRERASVVSRNFFIVVVLLLLVSCADHGLSPIAEPPGFGGTITVKPPWAPPDSLFDLRVVAFRNNPPGNILEEVANNRALISSRPLQFNVTTQEYKISAADVSGTFKYIAVAQQYTDSITSWKAVGIYSTTGDWNNPSAITLDGARFVPDVDITVDFYNLPPQPF